MPRKRKKKRDEEEYELPKRFEIKIKAKYNKKEDTYTFKVECKPEIPEGVLYVVFQYLADNYKPEEEDTGGFYIA